MLHAHPLGVAALIAVCMFGAVLLGMRIRRILPEHHLSTDSKDVVKLSMGLVATVTAMLLAFLLASAKNSYDTSRGEVVQMAAKTVLLDRLLLSYGAETAPARAHLRAAVADAVEHMWPAPGAAPARLTPNFQLSTAVYVAVQCLVPRSEMQKAIKAQAVTLLMQIGELRWLLHAQMVSSISPPMLVIIALWLVTIFLSFSMLAPSNATLALALKVSALCVAGAIYLILELDQPFSGLIKLSSEPMLQLLNLLAR